MIHYMYNFYQRIVKMYFFCCFSCFICYQLNVYVIIIIFFLKESKPFINHLTPQIQLESRLE